jgi:hypothetical protein
MNQIEFTPRHQTVLDDICSGGAIHGAIAAASLLPKDTPAWRRELPPFRRRVRTGKTSSFRQAGPRRRTNAAKRHKNAQCRQFRQPYRALSLKKIKDLSAFIGVHRRSSAAIF